MESLLSVRGRRVALAGAPGLVRPWLEEATAPGGAACQPGSLALTALLSFSKKSQKWDEMNILATYHPEGKDYGLMKIDEPSTPYHSMVGDDDDDAVSDSESNEPLTADVLAKKLAAAEGKGPKILAPKEESSEEEEEEELTPEEREKRKQFEMKRKMHYNEGRNIKLARQLIAKELHGEVVDEDEDEEMQDAAEVESMSTETSEHVCLKWVKSRPVCRWENRGTMLM
uniref:Protein phosphatase inhibitor 2 n=1 Tax=Sphenodon punctatus TaxID=8508 RepID=A0A8D0HBQ1_SPHPU